MSRKRRDDTRGMAEMVDAEAVASEAVQAEAEPVDEPWAGSEPDESNADLPYTAPYTVDEWRDGYLYGCRRCAFNTTKLDVIRKHRCA